MTPTAQITTPLEGALSLVVRGVPQIPLGKRTKVTSLPAWQHNATTDPSQLFVWDKEVPERNYGSVAQAKIGGFWMFEVDSPNVAERIEKETGHKLFDIQTLLVRSRVGRGHLYFKQTAASIAMGNITQNVAGRDWSARVDREYVVSPLSWHPTSGQQYMPLRDVNITEAPDWLIQWLLSQKTKAKKIIATDTTAPFPEGTRNSSLASLGGKARHAGQNADEIFTYLSRVNQERCVPPLSEEEVRTISNSVSRYETGKDERVTFSGVPGGTTVMPAGVAAPVTDATPFEWKTPESMGNALSPVMKFKLDFLPLSIKPWVKDVTERMGVPLDFTGVASLVTLAGVTGRRVFVYPKAQDKEWKESISLSGAPVAPSGAMKTPTWKTFINVVVEQDSDWRRDHEKEMAAFKTAHDKWEADIKKNIHNAEPTEPKAPRRLLLNDATPEKMHEVMERNPEGVLYYRDELSSWVHEMDKKGYEVQRGLFLAAMNGNDAYGIDRIGRGTVFATMCASVFGSLQPQMLRDFMGNTRNVADGMIPRFPFLVWPDATLSTEQDRPADDNAKQMFRQIERRLAAMKAESISMHFDAEAQSAFNDWLLMLKSRIAKEQDSGKVSHMSKYRGALPKIAALLQVIDLVAAGGVVAGNQLIDLAHFNKAMSMMTYLESHMHRVYDSIQSPVKLAEDELVKRINNGELKDGFTLRDIKRKRWSGLSDSVNNETALETLEQSGWVHAVQVAAGARGGRPTLKWEVNPAITK